MIYYIKVLRSNLDNILSSESISPAAFYRNRGYGYDRFDHASDDASDYELYLSDCVEDSEEDVAYIELSAEDKGSLNSLDNSAISGHTVSSTIRLYPWNCRILFKSVEDAKDTIFICRSSLANKMWGCYAFDIISDVRPAPSPTGYAAEPIIGDIPTEIQRDRRINSLKGFAFAYYLGKICSLSPQLAMLLRAERNIYGLATVLSGMKTPAKEMVETIENLKRIFNANDPNRIELKQRWENMVLGTFSTTEDRKNFEEQLRRLGVQRQAMDAFAQEQRIRLTPRFDTIYATGREWQVYKNQIEEYTQAILNKYAEDKSLKDNDTLKIDGFTVGFTDESLKLYERLLSEMMKNTEWLSVERIRTQKLEAANAATKFVKEIIDESKTSWEGSEVQEYLNRLRRNIAYSEPFDPNETDDKSLRAMAIYILKGDTIDDMYKYMQMTGVEDYALVFGLWGVSTGYVDMPKTFSAMLGLKQDRVIDCYVRAYEVMAGHDVPKRPVADSYQEVLQKEKHVYKPATRWHSAQVKDNKEALYEENRIKELLRESPLKLSDEQQEGIMNIVKKNGGYIDENLFKAIGKIKGIGKKKLEVIKILFQPLKRNLAGQLPFPEETTNSEKVKIHSSDPWDVIEECLPDDDLVKEQIRRDYLWFMSKNKMGYEELIPKLCDYFYRNKNATGTRFWLRKAYKEVDVAQIEKRLRDTLL